MKTDSKSLLIQYKVAGNFCRIGLLVSLFAAQAAVLGCSSARSKASGYSSKEAETSDENAPKDYSKMPPELSLKEDRSYLDKIRSDTPEDIKKDNDELAFVMKMMGEVRERPEKVRERFNDEIRKRRERFNKLNQKDRENFNAKEKKDREDFMKEFNKKREKFVNSKHSAEDRREFFDEQETERRDYFSKQSDARHEFDSQIRERQSDFDSYIREKTADFNQEHRAYSERFRQWEKDKKAFDDAKEKYDQEQRAKGIIPGMGNPQRAAEGTGTGAVPEAQKAATDKDLEEFDKIPKTPADKLQPSDH